jgi:hypothetical protein
MNPRELVEQYLEELGELDCCLDPIEMYERCHLRSMTLAEVRERLLWERGE